MTGRRCAVIGGGSVAAGKVKGLLEADAHVTVISPQLTATLEDLANEGRITHIPRAYQAGDLAGVGLAISATDDRAVNEQVWQEATEHNILINIADDPPRCTFISPSVARRGDLTLAISTAVVRCILVLEVLWG